MAKETRITEAYVKIEVPTESPYFGNRYSSQEIHKVAEGLIKEITRHIDLPYGVKPSYEVEQADFCTHCDGAWEEDEDGCSCCCTKAIAEWEAANPEKAAEIQAR